MRLVISEKNIAARRIAYILSGGKMKSVHVGSIPVYEFMKNSEDWTVIGLKGHIVTVDYPAGFNQWNKIDPAGLIMVEPVKRVSEKGIASALKTLLTNSPAVIVATDFDREGELIGVEVVNLLKSYSTTIKEIKRARFSAITPYEINTAFENLTDVDYNLSNAGEARQVIDLVWGAVLTRFISLTSRRLGRDFLSIGRVQSPTLKLLVDREKEIKNFKPKPYWKIIAKLKKDKMFDAVHETDIFWDEQQAREIYQKIKDCKEALVETVKKTVEHETPPAPFNTTTFLQAASFLGYPAAKAMSLAEELYMQGLTSYPRTDNTVYPPSLNISGILQKLANAQFSKEVAEVQSNGRSHPTRGKMQTTDHPPIHPVDAPTKKLGTDQEKIYELICRRFLATLAKDAISETTDAVYDIAGEPFKTSGYRLIESHWKSIYPYFKDKKKQLPELLEGERIEIMSMTVHADETKPPARYTQGALIVKMEQLSLGTKSTRAEIISKLYQRKYISGQTPIPTSTAIAVVDALANTDVVKSKMTAELEEDMNSIAEGKKTLEATVMESRGMLTKVMQELEPEKEIIKASITRAIKEQNTVGPCPRCGKPLMVRISKKGKRFVGCTGYPECKNTYSLPQQGGLAVTTKVCDACGTPIISVKLKGRRTWALCLNSECPKKKKKEEKKEEPTT
ncbi:MAG TPA: DNA topoisomerase I [Candidatus Thermoplasmatota archaeon]|nr:DNA topoisomerase I [Candidatus Thermoplasmatota archaeon]